LEGRRINQTQGKAMLPSDSFLRMVPHALEAGPRLILDAAGWAINSILISFADLEKTAQEMPIKKQPRSWNTDFSFIVGRL